MRTKAESARLHKRMMQLLEEFEVAKKCEREMRIRWLESQVNTARCEDAVNLLAEKMRNVK